MICDSDLAVEREEWIEWLQNEDVPDNIKCDMLYSRDEKGWTPLHHAARFRRCGVLDAASRIKEGEKHVLDPDFILQ